MVWFLDPEIVEKVDKSYIFISGVSWGFPWASRIFNQVSWSNKRDTLTVPCIIVLLQEFSGVFWDE